MADELREREMALIAAIRSRRFEDATRLLEEGADPRVTDDSGLTACDHALLSGDRDFFTHISKVNRRINVETVISRFPGLCQTFLSLPDFRVSFNWRVVSWIPFVSAFCPSDTWVLTKAGSRLRIDTTLANWSGFRWTRGSMTVYFDAASPDMMDSFVAIDNVSGVRFSVLREVVESLDVETDIGNLMRLDLIKGFIQIDAFRKAPARRWFGWRVGARTHDQQWGAVPVDIWNAKVRFLHYYWEEFGRESPRLRVHEKTYKGRFWLSIDFPVQPGMLVPFLETMAPFRETARNLLTLLGMFEEGMPVKGEIAVFPTVKMEFAFDHFSGDVDSFRDDCIPPPE
jgi:hypothetical protein